jgi:NAD-dependent SIR2 family protein deacetylase
MVQKGHVLRFSCKKCHQPVEFSVIDQKSAKDIVCCQHCNRNYSFEDEGLQRQLRLFEGLCRQIAASEEILSNASVGIDVGSRQVKVPYKLLLTRFNSSLELDIGGVPTTIDFRLEPLKDCPTCL